MMTSLLLFFAVSILKQQCCQSDTLYSNTNNIRNGSKSYELYEEKKNIGMQGNTLHSYFRRSTSSTRYSNPHSLSKAQSRFLSISETRFFRQVGERITDYDEETGTSEKDMGQSVSMSDDGSVIAVSGVITQSASDEHSFLIKVYTLINGNWQLKGQAIQDTDSVVYFDDAKAHVCLSGDGNKLAISTIFIKSPNVPNPDWKGTVEVYDYNTISDQWVLSSIMYEGDGGKGGHLMGIKASLDTTGSMIAIGIPSHDVPGIVDDVGQVQVCNVGNPDSCQILSDTTSSKNSGTDIQITGNDAQFPCVVWGSPDNGESTGSISVLCDESNSGVWSNRPFKDDERFGEYDGDQFGISVSISADGNFVAAGAWKNDGATSEDENVGSVRVYQFIESTGQYERLGGDIYGERGEQSERNSEKYYVGDGSGFSISLSNNVNGILRVLIGAPHNPGADINEGYYNGHVRLYECYLDTGATPSWNRVLGDLDGTLEHASFGHSVAMNRDGTRMIVGSPRYGCDDNHYYAGAVTVYELADSEPSEAPSPSPSISASPSSNPSNPEIEIEASPQKVVISGLDTTAEEIDEIEVIAGFTQSVKETLIESLALAPNEELTIYEVALVKGEAASGEYGLQFDGVINQVSFFFRCRIITRNPAFVIPANVAIDALSNPEYVAALRNTLADPETGESVIDESAIVVEVEDVTNAFQIKTNYYDYDFEDDTTWCLTASKTYDIGITSMINVRRCNSSDKLQIWTFDDLDQLKLIAFPLNPRCIKSESLTIFMQTCETDREDEYSWSIESKKGGQVIKQFKYNQYNYIGIEAGRIFARVRLIRDEAIDINDSLGEWEVVNGYYSYLTETFYQV